MKPRCVDSEKTSLNILEVRISCSQVMRLVLDTTLTRRLRAMWVKSSAAQRARVQVKVEVSWQEQLML